MSSSPLRDRVIVGCCNVITDDAGRYLLVRESKPSARSRFNLPAGKLEVGETVSEAAAREAKEETGLDVEVEHLIGLYQCVRTTEDFAVVNFVFASRVVGGALTETVEHPVVRFFSRQEISELAEKGLIRGTHIEMAIDDHRAGQRLPADLVRNFPPSALATR
jgi:ADP-ribose pyrophosphatase YjhB (NUDIX family)